MFVPPLGWRQYYYCTWACIVSIYAHVSSPTIKPLEPQVNETCYYNPFEKSNTTRRNLERHLLGGPNGNMFVFAIDTKQVLTVSCNLPLVLVPRAFEPPRLACTVLYSP